MCVRVSLSVSPSPSSSPLAPLALFFVALSSLFLTRPPSRMHTHVLADLSLSLFLCSSFSFLLLLLDSFSSSPRLASPVRVAPTTASLYQPLLSATLALPRSSNLPIVRFRRIRPTVMDYRSAHGRRTDGRTDARSSSCDAKRNRNRGVEPFCKTVSSRDSRSNDHWPLDTAGRFNRRVIVARFTGGCSPLPCLFTAGTIRH